MTSLTYKFNKLCVNFCEHILINGQPCNNKAKYSINNLNICGIHKNYIINKNKKKPY